MAAVEHAKQHQYVLGVRLCLGTGSDENKQQDGQRRNPQEQRIATAGAGVA